MTEAEREIVLPNEVTMAEIGERDMALSREQMAALLRIEGRFSLAVREAMRSIPRDIFVPEGALRVSYHDRPIAYKDDGMDAPVSQPTVIAEMVDWLRPEGKKILEVGTGTGYQAAILGFLAREVYSVDISERAIDLARRNLILVGAKNVRVKAGDGMLGWPQAAPFDGIIVAATVPPVLPKHLYNQLKPGGRIVMPMAGDFQEAFQEFARENNLTEAQVREVEGALKSRCKLRVVEKGEDGEPKTIYLSKQEWSFVPIQVGRRDWWGEAFKRIELVKRVKDKDE